MTCWNIHPSVLYMDELLIRPTMDTTYLFFRLPNSFYNCDFVHGFAIHHKIQGFIEQCQIGIMVHDIKHTQKCCLNPITEHIWDTVYYDDHVKLYDHKTSWNHKNKYGMIRINCPITSRHVGFYLAIPNDITSKIVSKLAYCLYSNSKNNCSHIIYPTHKCAICDKLHSEGIELDHPHRVLPYENTWYLYEPKTNKILYFQGNNGFRTEFYL